MTSVQGDPSHEEEAAQAARREFALRLGNLHQAAGSPSLRWVAATSQRHIRSERQDGHYAQVSAQRISDWKSGRNVPARFETLKPVLTVLSNRARRRGPVSPGLVDLHAWSLLWDAAQPTRGSRGEKRGRCQPPRRHASTKFEPRPIGDLPSDEPCRFAGISLSCDKPEAVARFYLELLGGQLLWRQSDSIGFCISPALTVVAKKMANYVASPWRTSSIIHFSLAEGEDVAEYESRALLLGADLVTDRAALEQQVFLDPAGHPFSISAHPVPASVEVPS